MDLKTKNLKDKYRLFLTENAILRYITFSVLYIAQGIPEGITFFAIPAWLAMNEKSPMEIASFVAVIGIPWSFKILVAPLMDRFTLLSMGRKRPWVIFGQIGLILSFLSIGLIHDPLNNITGLMISGFFISFFGAFQDVATDGMAIDVIPVNEQARANGLMWGAKTIGVALSLVIGTTLINLLGFSTAITSMSISTFFIILVPICFRERPGEKLTPWSKGKASPISKKAQLTSWTKIFRCIYKVTILPSSLILAFAMFTLGIMYGLIDTLLPIFTIQELDWTNTSYSNVYSITTVVAGFFGMFIGGALVDFFGKKRMLSIYLIFLIVLIASFSFLPSIWNNDKVIFSFILLYYLGYTFLTIAIFASAMQLCWKTVAATQFTLYMALSNTGRAIGSGLVGTLKELMDWEYVFIIIAMSPLIAFFLMQLINFKKHKKSIKKFTQYSISAY
ncbi:MFS transporter [Tamlana fucoidanivorans]|uniref:AmpG family muropeptide MFS transporter n=1 Tax=Allotamlana fucoidanivorans TaxID=2583814 RepID=A0A5C4SHQ2_9FLAO|nr:MFS transporter [Tamlana fucoidanivorans]TNJ43199.1 AmpG family muropeptide MFS transporter [Tamlana fucoidanivorans]